MTHYSNETKRNCRKKTGAALALALTLGLTAGCSSDASGEPSSNGTVAEIVQTLHDGRQVTCLVYHARYKGGLSCDWDGASK